MASEDSDELMPGFLPIHRLHDLRDLDKTFGRLVPAGGDQLDAVCELLEVLLLRASHRMTPEERDDRLQEIRAATNDVAVHLFPVVVTPPVRNDVANVEVLTNTLEARDARGALRDRELVRDLETGPVAFSPHAVRLPHEADGEASFSVYKTDHPATELDQPFLLVFRTRHVVTIVNVPSDGTMSSAGYSGFPAYSQMRTAPLPMRGATIAQKICTVLLSHVTLGRL
jgi:hypothetical protein